MDSNAIYRTDPPAEVEVDCLVHNRNRPDAPCICKTLGIIRFDERAWHDCYGKNYVPTGVWVTGSAINIFENITIIGATK
jgi:hypothetical protein